tara:strand:- start:1001 stop:1126 length:126 start_codon:yes stop_codon:yes gene_type:complete
MSHNLCFKNDDFDRAIMIDGKESIKEEMMETTDRRSPLKER